MCVCVCLFHDHVKLGSFITGLSESFNMLLMSIIILMGWWERGRVYSFLKMCWPTEAFL